MSVVETITYMEKINLDEEMEKDLSTNNGFLVTSAKGIKKDLKDIDGVFSTRFGRTLRDEDSFVDRYKCTCGEVTHKINHGLLCDKCNTRVEFVDDNFSYFGWIRLDQPHAIIHPNLFMSLADLVGPKKLENMILFVDEKDKDGNSIDDITRPKDEPFYGIGMTQVRERINEILRYYEIRNSKKAESLKEIRLNKDKLFTRAIPVFSALMRPFKDEAGALEFEETNRLYELMPKLAQMVNDDSLNFFRMNKPKEQVLYELQTCYNELYKEIISIISGKEGTFRQLFGGRCNFTARNVVTSEPLLRVDQVSLSYFSLVEMLQQRIINILCKSHNMSLSDAQLIWYKASIKIDDKVWNIIQGIIDNTEEGIPVLINRNPTIAYGSILQCYVTKINKTHTLGIPLQILKITGGDYDKLICRTL